MNANVEAAELVVRTGSEAVLKLTGLGATNLAALLLAVINEQNRTGLGAAKQMIRDGDEMTLISIKQKDLAAFQKEAKKYGFTYFLMANRKETPDMVEVVVKMKDAIFVNRVMEHLGYPAPSREGPDEKKETSRAQSENSSKQRGTTSKTEPERETDTESKTEPGKTADADREPWEKDDTKEPWEPERKPSVKDRLEDLANEAAKAAKGEPARETVKDTGSKLIF